jgi:cytochrome c
MDHGLAARDGKPDTKNVACMRDCGGPAKVASEIPDYARDAHGNLAEQVRALGPVDGLANAASAKRGAPRERPAGDLAKSAGCMACHGVSGRIVGPGFREVGSRYANDAAAKAGLVARVREGGAGRWGSVPMPAQTHVADRDLETLVQWILAGSP